MRRRSTVLLALVVLLLTPSFADATSRPRAKHKKKKVVVAVKTVTKMPTAAELAAEQAKRVAQAMLLLEQQQADQAQDLGGGAFQGASIPSRYGPIQVTVNL